MGNPEPQTQGTVETQNNPTPRSLHTPGPWAHHVLLSGSENDKGFRITASDGRDGRIWIADASPVIYANGNASQEGKANASLIAAAPDLLKACKLALEKFTSPDVAEERRAFCRAAIAKAEGAPSVSNRS